MPTINKIRYVEGRYKYAPYADIEAVAAFNQREARDRCAACQDVLDVVVYCGPHYADGVQQFLCQGCAVSSGAVESKECGHCNGMGEVVIDTAERHGFPVDITHKCADCDGLGRVPA